MGTEMCIRDRCGCASGPAVRHSAPPVWHGLRQRDERPPHFPRQGAAKRDPRRLRLGRRYEYRCGPVADPRAALDNLLRSAVPGRRPIRRNDRSDIHIDVPAVASGDLALPPPAEGSAAVARRVATARARQAARYAALPAQRRIGTNAEADGALLDEIASPEAGGRALLLRAAERLRLSARGYHRVLRVARTLADLEGSSGVGRRHIAEALSYRRLAAPLKSAPSS